VAAETEGLTQLMLNNILYYSGGGGKIIMITRTKKNILYT
jgi:hypothetical protein